MDQLETLPIDSNEIPDLDETDMILVSFFLGVWWNFQNGDSMTKKLKQLICNLISINVFVL